MNQTHGVRQDVDQPAVLLFAYPERGGGGAEPDESFYSRQQFVNPEGFDEVFVRASFEAIHLLDVARCFPGTQRDKNIAQPRVILDLAADFHAADVRQLHIHQRQIRAVPAHQLKSPPSGFRKKDFVTSLFETE